MHTKQDWKQQKISRPIEYVPQNTGQTYFIVLHIYSTPINVGNENLMAVTGCHSLRSSLKRLAVKR